MIRYFEEEVEEDLIEYSYISEKLKNSVGWKVHSHEELRDLIKSNLKGENNND